MVNPDAINIIFPCGTIVHSDPTCVPKGAKRNSCRPCLIMVPKYTSQELIDEISRLVDPMQRTSVVILGGIND